METSHAAQVNLLEVISSGSRMVGPLGYVELVCILVLNAQGNQISFNGVFVQEIS